MSTYLHAWDLIPGQSLIEAIAEAEAQLPVILDAEAVELIGEPHWRVGLIMTADAMPALDRYQPPWETPLAGLVDMIPEAGWQPDWDRKAAA